MPMLISLLTVLSPIALKLIDKLFPEKITRRREWAFGKRHKVKLMERIQRRTSCWKK